MPFLVYMNTDYTVLSLTTKPHSWTTFWVYSLTVGSTVCFWIVYNTRDYSARLRQAVSSLFQPAISAGGVLSVNPPCASCSNHNTNTPVPKTFVSSCVIDDGDCDLLTGKRSKCENADESYLDPVSWYLFLWLLLPGHIYSDAYCWTTTNFQTENILFSGIVMLWAN